MTTTTIVNNKSLINSPVYLPVGQSSGNFKISIPFMAEYIMVLNDTAATIAVCVGEQSTQTADAQLWTPGKYISMPLVEQTQKLTVFWSSPQNIAADNNLVQFYFSNVTIPLQGGSYGAAAESQDVNVLNTVTVQYGLTPSMNVLSLPALPTGTNKIGKVDLSATGNLVQGITAGVVSSNQVAMSTSAAAIINGVVNGQRIKIKNDDGTNSIFIGTSSVTTSTGYELAPKEILDFEVISGSTISIYGIASTGTPKANILILN